MSNERMARIEGIDLTSGTFPMTLATEGEASDGHILSIKGGIIPERFPMLVSHLDDPTEVLGSITDPVKHLKDSPPRLKTVGHIEMGGEGPNAEIRRDIAHMIDKGHITSVSVRWDPIPGKSIRRVNLPSDHPHFVDAEKAQGPERFGLFFEEWRALEGSIVALGADQGALIGRSKETEGAVSDFWRKMADDLKPHPEPEDESSSAKIAASLAALRIDATDCREAGASHADCINAVVDREEHPIEAVEIDDYVLFCSEPVATVLREKLDASEVQVAEIEELQTRLEALEEELAKREQSAALEEDRVTEAPIPSPERVEAVPLAALDPITQAEVLRATRKPSLSPLEIVERITLALKEEREAADTRWLAMLEEKRGKVRPK